MEMRAKGEGLADHGAGLRIQRAHILDELVAEAALEQGGADRRDGDAAQPVAGFWLQLRHGFDPGQGSGKGGWRLARRGPGPFSAFCRPAPAAGANPAHAAAAETALRPRSLEKPQPAKCFESLSAWPW